MEKTDQLQIVTPEGVTFSLRLAGPTTRFTAWFIDLCCIALISKVINLLSIFVGMFSPDFGFAFHTIIYFIVSLGYGIVLEWLWRGQTIGKRVMKLQVLDADALPLKFSQVVIRNLFRVVDMLPLMYLVGGVSSALTSRVQRLGDIVANTIVIRHTSPGNLNISHVFSDKYNSFRDYPHIEARLRQLVSLQEAGIALEALLRRDQIDPQSRVELFDELADHFKAILKFPEEATFGLSSEHYVRNVVDSIYNRKTTAS